MNIDEKLERLADEISGLKDALTVEARLTSRYEPQTHDAFQQHIE
jgi:hypothetical protein